MYYGEGMARACYLFLVYRRKTVSTPGRNGTNRFKDKLGTKPHFRDRTDCPPLEA